MSLFTYCVKCNMTTNIYIDHFYIYSQKHIYIQVLNLLHFMFYFHLAHCTMTYTYVKKLIKGRDIFYLYIIPEKYLKTHCSHFISPLEEMQSDWETATFHILYVHVWCCWAIKVATYTCKNYIGKQLFLHFSVECVGWS